MATFTPGKNAKVYIEDSGGTERDISDVITSVTLPNTSEVAETTTLGKTTKTNLATLKDNTVSFEGNRDATVEGYLFGIIGEDGRVRYFPEGSSSGKVYFDGTAIGTSLSTTSDVGDANKFSFEAQGSDTFSRRTV